LPFCLADALVILISCAMADNITAGQNANYLTWASVPANGEFLAHASTGSFFGLSEILVAKSLLVLPQCLMEVTLILWAGFSNE